MPDKVYLRQMQSLPLIAKIRKSQARIEEWYRYFDGNVFVSFSGGKDSTVLAHLVHEYHEDVPLVFCNTGLEYPEVRQFAERMGAVTIYPKMSFSEVISKYGYPIISKENAEAIHYARKIVVGGVQAHSGKTERVPVQTNLLKRREINGCRVQPWGGGSRQSDDGRTSEVRESIPGSNRLETRNAHRPASQKSRGGGYSRTGQAFLENGLAWMETENNRRGR